MIERRWAPYALGVALQTIMRELVRRMIRILRLIERVRVTLPAIRVRQIVIASHVTTDTWL